jgi:hypothetical protein
MFAERLACFNDEREPNAWLALAATVFGKQRPQHRSKSCPGGQEFWAPRQIVGLRRTTRSLPSPWPTFAVFP